MARKKAEENTENADVEEKAEVKEETTEKPSWVKISQKELEKLVVELAQAGETPSKIGMILRDKHGIPRVKGMGKKVTKILKENGIKFKTEKEIIQAEIDMLKKHVDKNKKDHSASRALTKKLWALQRAN